MRGGRGASCTANPAYGDESRGYNGGGAGVYGGGGATHIATNNRGGLANYKDYQDEILIVAGGGSGIDNNGSGSYGGCGGGLEGTSGWNTYYTSEWGGAGGTQTGPGTVVQGSNPAGYLYGTFGKGADSNGGPDDDYYNSSNSGGAGGGGWYGGNSGHVGGGNGGGGSGYIGGVMSTSTITRSTIVGDQLFLTPWGAEMQGNWYDGFARITIVGD